MKRLILLCVLSVIFTTSCKKEAILLDVDDSNTVTLYPNPVYEGGEFAVNLFAEEGQFWLENVIFRLINKNGEVFWETPPIPQFPIFAGSSFSTNGIPPGIYIFDCETDNGLLRGELVIYPGL